MSYEIKDPNAPATKKQTWAIKCLGGGDVRDTGLTRQQASEMIGELKAAKGQVAESKPKVDYAELWEKATTAGLQAGKDALPTPMVVSQHTNPLDDDSPVEQAWYVGEGACGFAWVNFKMKGGLGRKFGQWLIKDGRASKDSYYGGVSIWISDHGQSVERKSAHANAMAAVLRKAGIEDAYPMSRMD